MRELFYLGKMTTRSMTTAYRYVHLLLKKDACQREKTEDNGLSLQLQISWLDLQVALLSQIFLGCLLDISDSQGISGGYIIAVTELVQEHVRETSVRHIWVNHGLGYLWSFPFLPIFLHGVTTLFL